MLQLAIPGFDQGTFPQGSRLNPFGGATGLNPMISLGNSLRIPARAGSPSPRTRPTPYLRSVTVDTFDGDAWYPMTGSRAGSRERAGSRPGMRPPRPSSA